MSKNRCLFLTKQLIESFNRNDMNDLAHFDEIVDQNVQYHDLHTNKTKNLTAFKKAEKQYIEAFPNKFIQLDDICEIGSNRVVARWTTTCTHTGNYYGIAPTNKECRISGMTIWHFENNKIVAAWQLWDRLGLLEQIGALPAYQ